MMVPSSKLLVWFGLIALPVSVVAGMVPQGALACALALCGLAVLVLLDALWAMGSLDGFTVEMPEVVRMTQDKEGALDVRVRNRSLRPKSLRVGLPFPPEMASPFEDLLVAVPSGCEISRWSWPCTPSRRGKFAMDRCYMEGSSPLGFWAVRRSHPLRTEIRAYPNLQSERHHLAAMFLNRGWVGIHAQRQVGQGREFEKLREYVRGDSFGDIHWKATAKRGKPITKEYQIERTQEIYLILDASRLSARRPVRSDAGPSTPSPPADENLLERGITAALVMEMVAEKQGDLFGLLAFSDQVLKFVRARSGKAHFAACRDALYTLQPQRVTPDFNELASFIRLRLRRRALLVFLTSLDDPTLAEGFVRAMDLLCHHHLILVNMLRPHEARPLFDETRVETVNDLYPRLAGHIQWQSLREIDKTLHQRGIQFTLLDNERMCIDLVSQYISVKRRQIL